MAFPGMEASLKWMPGQPNLSQAPALQKEKLTVKAYTTKSKFISIPKDTKQQIHSRPFSIFSKEGLHYRSSILASLIKSESLTCIDF